MSRPPRAVTRSASWPRSDSFAPTAARRETTRVSHSSNARIPTAPMPRAIAPRQASVPSMIATIPRVTASAIRTSEMARPTPIAASQASAGRLLAGRAAMGEREPRSIRNLPRFRRAQDRRQELMRLGDVILADPVPEYPVRPRLIAEDQRHANGRDDRHELQRVIRRRRVAHCQVPGIVERRRQYHRVHGSEDRDHAEYEEGTEADERRHLAVPAGAEPCKDDGDHRTEDRQPRPGLVIVELDD